MPSLKTGHVQHGRRSEGANVDDGAENEAVDEVKADKEVEGEDGVGNGREAGKDNGEGDKSEDGGDEKGWEKESKQEGFF